MEPFYSMNSPHPAPLLRPLQLLALIFCIMGMTACVSTPSDDPPGIAGLPPGIYNFDCPIVYKEGLVELSDIPGGVHVQMLEKLKGSFELHSNEQGELIIRNDEMHYPGLKRIFNGEGRLTAAEGAEGTAAIWLKNLGPVGKDHRKGDWVLRPATEQEITRYEAKVRSLEERKRKAGMLEE